MLVYWRVIADLFPSLILDGGGWKFSSSTFFPLRKSTSFIGKRDAIRINMEVHHFLGIIFFHGNSYSNGWWTVRNRATPMTWETSKSQHLGLQLRRLRSQSYARKLNPNICISQWSPMLTKTEGFLKNFQEHHQKKGTPWFNPPIFTMKIASNSHVIQIPVEVPTLLRCMRTSPSWWVAHRRRARCVPTLTQLWSCKTLIKVRMVWKP